MGGDLPLQLGSQGLDLSTLRSRREVAETAPPSSDSPQNLPPPGVPAEPEDLEAKYARRQQSMISIPEEEVGNDSSGRSLGVEEW